VPDGTLVMTKVDRDPETGRFDGDRVRRSFEESLDRLGVDHLPLLHLHDPHAISVDEALAADGVVPALVRLRDEGLVDAIGVATGPPELAHAYVSTGLFDAVLSHNCLTLVDRTAEPLFRDARERGMTVLNAAPFGGGILAGSANHRDTYAYRPAGAGLLATVARMEDLCEKHGVPLAAAALAFSMRHPLVDATVVGISSSERLAQLRTLLAAAVPAALLDELEELRDTADRR
jgi:D-threo-aldose 1-dehydrogenase